MGQPFEIEPRHIVGPADDNELQVEVPARQIEVRRYIKHALETHGAEFRLGPVLVIGDVVGTVTMEKTAAGKVVRFFFRITGVEWAGQQQEAKASDAPSHASCA